MGKTKNVIIGGLIVAIIAMSVGYATLAQNLVINATANIAGNWLIHFTDIDEGSMVKATTVGTPELKDTSVTFEVDLNEPGATATYDIEISNDGTIDAELASITGVDTANAAQPTEIQYTVTGVSVGDALKAGDSTVCHVTVTWDSTSEEIPETKTKKATITLNYKQTTPATTPVDGE